MNQSAPARQDVERVLAEFRDPESGRSIADMEQVHGLEVGEGRIHVQLGLTTHSAPLWQETRQALSEQLRQRFPQVEVEVEVGKHERPPQKLGQIGITAKSVIAVGSGKGGVGKSTIAACLAWSLKRAGAQVGLMDADVYGPSIPHLLGLSGRPEVDQESKKIVPIELEGMPVISMGFLVPPGEAVVWRGPMLHGAVTQFLRDTRWGPLDYLIIDMPPGTGDIALTLSQLLPLTGAVVVCTPQDVALLDAVKAIAMFRKVQIPVLGIVENMSGFVCSECGTRHDIFGSGGAREEAERLQIPFLGEVPINVGIRIRGDAGETPQVFADATTAACFDRLAGLLVRNQATAAAHRPPQPQLPVL